MRHIRVLVVDELVELIKRRRAFIVLLLYILLIGSLLHGFSKVQSSVMTFLQERGGGIQIQGEDVLKAIGHFEGKAAFEHVLKWPLPFLLFQFFAVLWMSELIALVSCDVISRERSRGSLRYILLRTSRGVFYFSRFFAHFMLYALVHSFSIVALFTLMWFRGVQDMANLEPVIRYSFSLLPTIALSLAVTVCCSSLSRSTVGALMKIHLVWIFVYAVFLLAPSRLLSWRSFLGIIAPFGEYGWANWIGYLLLASIFLGVGYLVFRRSEV